MTFEFPCESCSSTLRVPESQIGKKGRCPSCQHVNVIPQPPAPVTTPATPQGFSPAAAPTQPAANPYTTPVPGRTVQQPITPDLGAAFKPIFDTLLFIRILGWVLIISGVLYCISIVGLIFGWVPLWMGISLRNAALKLESGYPNGNMRDLQEASKGIATFFKIAGILCIIYFVLLAAYIVFFLIAGLMLLLAGAAA